MQPNRIERKTLNPMSTLSLICPLAMHCLSTIKTKAFSDIQIFHKFKSVHSSHIYFIAVCYLFCMCVWHIHRGQLVEAGFLLLTVELTSLGLEASAFTP